MYLYTHRSIWGRFLGDTRTGATCRAMFPNFRLKFCDIASFNRKSGYCSTTNSFRVTCSGPSISYRIGPCSSVCLSMTQFVWLSIYSFIYLYINLLIRSSSSHSSLHPRSASTRLRNPSVLHEN